jgi:EmrB/QacA subfamily drug resistance transporter
MDLSPTEIRTVVIGAMLALFLAALDQTVVATALPSIAKDLGGFALISWIVTAYLLTATCVTPLVGKLSDLYGRRVVLRICLGVFILGSVLCALAPSMILLILARAVQGVGGGGLMTMAQTIIGDVVSPRERGRYAGYFSIVWGSSSVLGPTIGGVVTDQIGWPWIFWINLPLGLLALVISDHALRKLPVAGRRSTLEFAGIVLLCAATIALLLIFSLGGHRLAWGSPQILILAVAALALAASFVWQQRQSPEPIFPSRFFRDGVTAPVLASIFVVYGSYLAVAVLAPSYFQVALGSSVSEAGLLMIPFMLSSTLTANLAGQYSRRSGRYKPPPLIGLPVAALSLAVLPPHRGKALGLWHCHGADGYRARAWPDLSLYDRCRAKRRRAARPRRHHRRGGLCARARRSSRGRRGDRARARAGLEPAHACGTHRQPRRPRQAAASAGGAGGRRHGVRVHVRRHRVHASARLGAVLEGRAPPALSPHRFCSRSRDGLTLGGFFFPGLTRDDLKGPAVSQA